MSTNDATTTPSNTSQPQSSLQERQKTALTELSSLGRVSHRLALVDTTERLQTVLEKLLPRLLKRIGDNHREQQQQLASASTSTATSSSDAQQQQSLADTYQKIHAKLVEMLSHTMARVRHDNGCKIPCKDIMELLLVLPEAVPADTTLLIPKAKSAVDPFTLNLTLAFLTLGVPRCDTRQEVEALLPGLFVLLGQYSSGMASIRTAAKKSQSQQVAHILLRAMEWLIRDENTLAKPKQFGAPSSKKSSTTTTAKEEGNSQQQQQSGQSHDAMELVQGVCRQDPLAAGAVSDLLLDGLLYQPVAGNVPPSGLSQAGHERLKAGSSTTARDWAAEKAPQMQLMEFKLAILDFIAPSRRFSIFMGSNNNNSDTISSQGAASMGTARTVALLVVASGDANVDVVQRASTYLKIHHDSFRGSSSNKPDSTSSFNNNNNSSDEPSPPPSLDPVSPASSGASSTVGDAVAVTCGLLSLALGQTNAESAIARIVSSNEEATATCDAIKWLGVPPEKADSSDSSQLTLSLKRRAASESTTSTILNYIADKIFEDNLQLLHFGSMLRVQVLATLPLLSAQRTLSNLRTASGLSVLQAKAYVAAAKLLNILCVRVASFYDSPSYWMADETEEKKEEVRYDSKDQDKIVIDLLARALSTACSVLAPASSKSGTSSSAVVSNDGSMAIRDSCYGVLCSLSRSRFVLADEAHIFSRGETLPKSNSGACKVSTETASLLFGCAAHEVEHLRPRAVAALDALLGAYCRVYIQKDMLRVSSVEKDGDMPMEDNAGMQGSIAPVNPWAAVVSDAKVVGNGGNSNQLSLDTQGLTKALLPLLWSASQTTRSKSSRVAAARWATDLLKDLNVTDASHLLCFLAGDSDVTASSIAREGLGLPTLSAIASSDSDDYLPYAVSREQQSGIPEFSDYTAVIFPSQTHQQTSSSYWRPQYWDFSFSGKAAALRFGLVCLFQDIYGGEDAALQVYVKHLCDTLILFGSKDSGLSGASKGRESLELLEECAHCLFAVVSTSQFARSLLVWFSSSPSTKVSMSHIDIEFLALTANSSVARRHLASCFGRLLDDVALWCEPENLEQWLELSQIHRILERCLSKLTNLHGVVGEVHGAALLSTQCVRAFRLFACRVKAETVDTFVSVSQVIKALGKGASHSDEVVANACTDGLATALSFESIDAPILDQRLYDCTAFALNQIATALQKSCSTEHLDAPRASKLARAVGNCLAASTSGAGAVSDGDDLLDLGPARLLCVETLFSVLGSPAFRKDEELALLAGEALACYADAYGPDSAVWSTSVAKWPAGFDEKVANDLPPHQQVLYTLIRKFYASNSPHKRTACAAALLAIIGRASSGVNRHENYSRRYLVVEIQRNMSEVQSVFISLLSDPKSRHLSRESCCLGLAACRGLTKATVPSDEQISNSAGDKFSTEELNHRLIRAFGQTTNFGGSAYQETPEQAAQRRAAERGESGAAVMEPFGEQESEVGGASGVSESALNSYKEMAAAAVALGRLDILYALLILSVSHEAWFTPQNKYKYSAASLLGDDSFVGTNSAELRKALRPHLKDLLPKILRACHSPNKATREQFSSLFLGLTGGGAESRSAITHYLLPTVDTLIEDCTNKLWRARVGACGALAEILVGRSWADLGGGPAVLDDDDIHTKTSSSKLNAGVRMLRLWRVAMRALDDVRGTVRESGESLARTIRGLSVRMCNPSLEDATPGAKLSRQEEIRRHESDASAASATTLRWLIKNGLNQQCAEATGICLSTLIAIIDVVRPGILQNLIPDLLHSLLCSMSGLEPSALNYLQARSSAHGADSGLSYENLERARLRLAQSGPIAAAVTKLLDMLPKVPRSVQNEVVPRLDAALRESVGFASRSAVADAVSTMSATCPKAFIFPGSSNTNPSVRLLRALYFASERERGQGARDKMVHALGNLAALCPGSSVRLLCIKACEKYNAATGNNDDPASRRASASALRAIAVRASNQLSDGGPKDIWFRRVLPVAFLGKKDSDAKISSLWTEVWEEGSISANLSHSSGEDDFGKIEEKLLTYLVQECSHALDDVSWSRRVSGAVALADLCNAGVLSPAPRSVNSSKVDAFSAKRAERRAQASTAALKRCLRLLMGPRLWTGKSEVINATVRIASQWTAAIADDEMNDAVLFGWDRKGEMCPWQPVDISPGQFSDDLFVGDKWFVTRHDEIEEEERHDSNEAPEVDEDDPEGGKLDFDECDKGTENEDDGRLSEEETELDTNQTSRIVFAGLCRFLLGQALPSNVSKHHIDSEEFLPYRVAALTGCRDLLASLTASSVGIEQKKEVYTVISPRLISLFDSTDGNSPPDKTPPPVLVARAIDCLGASFWEGIGSKDDEASIPTANVSVLVSSLFTAGGNKQPAWTVREASWLCMASLCSKCHPFELRSHKLVSLVVQCASQAQKDRKFWRVRFAGLKILEALVKRAGNRAIGSIADNPEEQDRQLLLEAVLPQKEDILKLTRSSLSDSEAKVTALSSDIIGIMSWWP